MSQEHFIKNIEIKNFKLFKDFKAKGFGRVNLIGGKNNVGKTAFMEACYLSLSESVEEFFSRLLEIKTHRDVVNNLLSKNSREEDIHNLIKENLDINIETNFAKLEFFIEDNIFSIIGIFSEVEVDCDGDGLCCGVRIPNEYTYSQLIQMLNFSLDNSKYKFSIYFISPYSNSNKELENIIGDLKLNKKYTLLNSYLRDVFNIDSIDIIKDKPMLEVNGNYLELSEYGQGVKSFINIIASLLLLEENNLFIDEIESGIHYSNYDRLWEIILTISKEQNVQVFATTHSKECIESYARVAKKLRDNEITFTELGKNKNNQIKAIVMDNERFFRELEVGNEVRGW